MRLRGVRLALGLLLIALLSSKLLGQPVPVDAQASGRDAIPFLWEISDGSRPSYLMGTIHLGVSLDQALPAPYRSSVEGARVVMSEMDADPSNLDPQAMMSASLLPAGQSLRSMMPASTWEALLGELSGTMPSMILDRLRPWVPVTVVAQRRIAASMRGDVPDPMDADLIRRARSRQQRVGFLETASEQIAIMNSVPSRHFVRELEQMLDDPTESDRELRAMLGAYRRGDAGAMTAMVFDAEDVAAMPEYYELLFRRRNRAWVQRLEGELQGSGGVFLAVGLGHLLGPDGLVTLLRARGLSVQRVGAR